MATSVHRDHLAGGEGNMMANPGTGVAFDIEISECVISNSPVPKWLRQRLEDSLESKTKSLDDIVTRLKEADVRRQQFHEWLANKARPKRRVSPPHSPKAGDLAQRLEAKLSAAEQKRAELQAQEQMRLARIHELRLAAKTETQLRMEREREELGCKVELRVHQAELNRLALLELEKQRIAAAHERLAQSAVVRTNQEGKDRERIEALRLAICQKIAAAEEKRACLLEAEKSRAQATVLQARRVAQEVVRERELELKNKREKLEARLQRARGQRAEFLRQRGGCRGSSHNHGQRIKNGDRLCRKLTRCWRQFRQSRCTTYALAKDYAACGLNEKSVTSISFEQLASRITSPITLRTVKALLARIESRLKLSLECQSSKMTCIDHLLKRLSPPARKPRVSIGSTQGKKHPSKAGDTSKAAAQTQSTPIASKAKEGQKPVPKELERYPVRVFLCAYMILGQPEAVFSSRRERELALAETAAKLLPEFEALTGIVLDGPSSGSPGPSSPNSSPPKMSKYDWPSDVSTTSALPSPRPFAAQLAAFDAAWCAYLYKFVAWKVKDAKVLEEDMTRMACQLEVSMLQKCRIPHGGNISDLSHDAKAIRTQVLEDQKLLRDRVLHLTGSAGLTRMEDALQDARSKYAEVAENGSPPSSPFRTPIGSSSASPSPEPLSVSPSESSSQGSSGTGKPKVVRSLFKFPTPVQPATIENLAKQDTKDSQGSMASHLGTELTNEHIVNEMFHDANWNLQETGKLTSSLGYSPAVNPTANKMNDMHSKVRSAMENAFWDNIASGLVQEPTDYKRVIDLVGEVREELEALVPDTWKDELRECMDLELITQILDSGSNDVEYLRRLLDYASGLILKLGSPARDSPAKAAHESLVKELSATVSSNSKDTQTAFFTTLVKGLRFIFEQLQVLKQDISATRLRAIAPLIGGTVGVDYLRSSFLTRYQLTTTSSFLEVTQKLPKTVSWFTEAVKGLEQEKLELETSLAPVQATLQNLPSKPAGPGIPPLSSMRTGGRHGVSTGATIALSSVGPAILSAGEKKFCEVQWKSNETLVRLGLLQILRSNEAASVGSLAETLVLNTARLHGYQNAFQQILVIATGLLIARQGLVSQGIAGLQLEGIIERGKQKLETLLNDPTASLTEIGTVLAEIANRTNEAETSDFKPVEHMSTELMTRVLRKSLSPDDPVFARVSAAVGASLRALLILGNGSEGMTVAQAALKRIGGLYLMDKVVSISDSLEVVAEVTCRVHEPCYSCILDGVRSQE
ncbi:hypothetical protein M758_11G023200 [Ceratodon purpureus]|nr:hypothetical protein M758_11G023200 [Ceratodon purpureus]